MTALITGLFGVIVQEAGDRFRVSKTKVAANIGGLNGFIAILPGVMEKDPQAIGQMVLWFMTWVGVLLARGNKG